MPQKALSLARAAKEEILSNSSDSNTNQNLPSGDAEIVTLGTGSALPSKYRNVSSTLLRVPGCGSYLLDCGENTLGQLKRVFGEAGVKEILRDLKLIWISHLHADHHLGTVSVVKAWRDEMYAQRPSSSDIESSRTRLPESPQFTIMSDVLNPTVAADVANPVKVLEQEKRLFISGTGQMMRWLKEYAGIEDYGYDRIIPLESVSTGSSQSPKFHLKWHHRDMGFGKEYPEM